MKTVRRESLKSKFLEEIYSHVIKENGIYFSDAMNTPSETIRCLINNNIRARYTIINQTEQNSYLSFRQVLQKAIQGGITQVV